MNITAESQDRQAAPRREMLHGAVSAPEKQEVADQLEAAGFRTMSDGIRCLGLLFARSPEIRELVIEHRFEIS